MTADKQGPLTQRVTRPKREDVRQRLLKAAQTQFTATGYDKTSLDQIAEAAGFSKGAIYSNFTNKEELFLTLMDQQVRERIRVVRDGSAIPSPSPGLHATIGAQAQAEVVASDIGRTLVSLIIQDAEWQLLFLEYVTRVARDPASLELFTQRRRNIRTVVASAAADLLGPDHQVWKQFTPETIALVVLALSNGLAIERIADPEGVPDDLFGILLSSLT